LLPQQGTGLEETDNLGERIENRTISKKLRTLEYRSSGKVAASLLTTQAIQEQERVTRGVGRLLAGAAGRRPLSRVRE
jgi:hypothetical protein